MQSDSLELPVITDAIENNKVVLHFHKLVAFYLSHNAAAPSVRKYATAAWVAGT